MQREGYTRYDIARRNPITVLSAGCGPWSVVHSCRVCLVLSQMGFAADKARMARKHGKRRRMSQSEMQAAIHAHSPREAAAAVLRYAVFLALFTAVTLRDLADPHAFYFVQGLRHALTKTVFHPVHSPTRGRTFDDVSTVQQLHQYLQGPLLEALFAPRPRFGQGSTGAGADTAAGRAQTGGYATAARAAAARGAAVNATDWWRGAAAANATASAAAARAETLLDAAAPTAERGTVLGHGVLLGAVRIAQVRTL